MNLSIIIPSYKRPYLLYNVIKSFSEQISIHDEIIVIIHSYEPYIKEYYKIIKKFKNKINITLLINKNRNLSRSYNMGLKTASKDIVLFSDDDCIPNKYLIKNHLNTYKLFRNIFGVSGIIVPSLFINNKIYPLKKNQRQGIHTFLYKPINKMNGWYLFITKGGNLQKLCDEKDLIKIGINYIFSLPLGGGNMSFKRKFLKNVFLDEDQKKAFRFEQFLCIKMLNIYSIDNYSKFILNTYSKTFHIENVKEAVSRPKTLKNSIELYKELIISIFKFKLLLSNKMSVTSMFFEYTLNIINYIIYSIKLKSKIINYVSDHRLKYIGAIIGSIIGIFYGIKYYIINHRYEILKGDIPN